MNDHSDVKPLGGRLFTWPVLFFGFFAIVCVVVIGKRLVLGLGPVTNLNGGYPWGIWIGFDLLVGTGFACGGWALAWAVYIFNKGEYHPLVRPALLASLFGYALGGLSILMDIGRWWNLPYFYIPGYFNTNSVLFETAICMTIYMFVLMVEFAPALLEKLGLKIPLKVLNKILFGVIALGALLPAMHQSSMGSLFLSAGHKIHPLWQSYEFLPLFSLLGALIMGFSIVVFEGGLVAAGMKGRMPDERPLFNKLISFVQILVGMFIVVRFHSINLTDKWEYVFAGDIYSWLFWIENFLLLWPILLIKRVHKSAVMLFAAAISLLVGAAMYRIDMAIVAYNPGDGYNYFPSIEEILLSFGLVAIEVVGYIVIIKLLPVLPGVSTTNRIHKA
ncbi:Ni/Fe-hydrogenase cytochrome b subunit [Vibrio sp. MACH09]|uniref:Ni/Fe-hydrogenase cytochrome b subunit n=1 Tax=unclassified Vibrio TaxID=2614977 RepID=UPI0014938FA3|nr:MULTISPECIES: Ni/Fe-hydrogenase cytochrome b subunit [unclassified Vibrio]NOI68683.1 Ni/Fe-hydrogenase cytochrome b subunit [Vibrio sp. 99-8-1]GLO62248.1 Ni/Fe-hydrogenase cytochrome b subunit [Vibrio sp. MACH09]